MKNPQKTIGYILLFPPLLSVVLFTINLLLADAGDIIGMHNLSASWLGNYIINGEGAGGYSSSLPIYFGIMAIAGAHLIKNSKEE